MLKKQTVWLLTMLSLVVVLSVYYVTSPEDGTGNMAMTGEEQANDAATSEEKAEEEKPAEEGVEEGTEEGAEKGEEAEAEGEVQTEEFEDGTVISSVTNASDELFTELRLQLDDQRNELKEQLQTIVASNDASPNEKSDAYDEMEALTDAAKKESIIETLIKSKGYEDALVRADGNNVKITIKAKEHDKSSANKIMALVSEEMDNMEDVIVTFEPAQ
ncbi:SpoIIIAH-like family protein [Metabacillus litoralis]|uniref:SpoIIIAH-like family protein n=1 Tax=Metabacillus litoralis TaxID=152268 RepID=UPI001CFD5B37|nr:SpoIIIAH-like family protein [Metabacillus litoralis]